MSVYVVGSSKNQFLPLDGFHKKFLVDQKHSGDNIDWLNPWYCELTGLYYIWKHDPDTIIGLEHYRRYLTLDGRSPISRSSAESILSKYDVICNKVEYAYEPIKSYLVKNRKAEETNSYISLLGAMHGKAYAEHCIRYLNGHEHVLGNMFIARRELANKYCEYLFRSMYGWYSIEKKKGHRIEGRICGYMSEFLFGAWLSWNHKNIKVVGLKML